MEMDLFKSKDHDNEDINLRVNFIKVVFKGLSYVYYLSCLRCLRCLMTKLLELLELLEVLVMTDN